MPGIASRLLQLGLRVQSVGGLPVPVTLLAVDDSVTMRKVLEMTFAGEDYRVVTADSADAAIALARSERPGIVVADTTLDGKTGYDLCQTLKRELPNVPVLLLSSK